MTIFTKSLSATLALALVAGCVTARRTAESEDEDDVPVAAFAKIKCTGTALADLCYDGKTRADAKETMVTATAVTYTTIQSVTGLNDLKPRPTETSGRVGAEQKLAQFDAYLYAYTKPSDNDFHLILGDTATPTAQTHMINVEVAGRPDDNDTVFKAVRTSFLAIVGNPKSISGYQCIIGKDGKGKGIKVNVSGGPFFDTSHASITVKSCGALLTVKRWEIHPVTSISTAP